MALSTLIEGLQILNKYEEGHCLSFAHNILYAGKVFEDCDDEEEGHGTVSEEDWMALTAIDWFFDVDNSCWAVFLLKPPSMIKNRL